MFTVHTNFFFEYEKKFIYFCRKHHHQHHIANIESPRKKNERHKYENEENKYENGKHIWLKVTVIIASIVKLLNINIHKIVYTKCRKIVK